MAKKPILERVGGRKFLFAMFVLFFVISSIVLNTILLVNGKITGQIYKDLYIFAGGFLTLLASSYFFANAKSKQFYNEDVNKLRTQISKEEK
jgi:hypothetical protein